MRRQTWRSTPTITRPNPSDLWVIMDENPDSINDPLMAISMVSSLVDFPAKYHAGAAGISFADGHSEVRRYTNGWMTLHRFFPQAQ